jgi:hypothetical protein
LKNPAARLVDEPLGHEPKAEWLKSIRWGMSVRCAFSMHMISAHYAEKNVSSQDIS